MSVHHGKNGKVKLGTDVVAEVTQFSVAETIPTSDTTAMGSVASTHLVGVPAWTATIEGNYDPADAGGQMALSIGAAITVGLYTEGDATGKHYMTGAGSVTGVNKQASFSERVTFSISVTGNGALTHSTVA